MACTDQNINILLQFCQKKRGKNVYLYIKIIHIVLLRTILRGIGAYSTECLRNIDMGARMGGGRVGACPPSLGKKLKYNGGLFAICSPC